MEKYLSPCVFEAFLNGCGTAFLIVWKHHKVVLPLSCTPPTTKTHITYSSNHAFVFPAIITPIFVPEKFKREIHKNPTNRTANYKAEDRFAQRPYSGRP